MSRLVVLYCAVSAVLSAGTCFSGIPRSGSDPVIEQTPLLARPSTLSERYAPPRGFVRTPGNEGSFSAFLRRLPLKPEGSQVHLFNGDLKRWQGAQAAVIDMSVGAKDLQQCADAVMRLRAEYLFSTDQTANIQFSFTNGFSAPFARWIKGERITVKGNECAWVPGAKPGATHHDLLNYLQVAFTYAGTLSLSKELEDASALPVQPGDLFIHGGSPGHAVIVADVATSALGEQVFMLAQSYMPAQEIHVLRNLENTELSPWYKMDQGSELLTPEWRFSWAERKRWKSP
ncbi:MAG: DUF4846 domain-containing protein [Flavobacteriales bacterium]|nr:DUF4846 domain-containing protein [Flavobacteriales bacterium]